MAYETYFCINPDCEMYKKHGEHIARRCSYGKEKDRELLYCKKCSKTFSAERQTLFSLTRLPKRVVYDILNSSCSRMSLRAISRQTGISLDTVRAVIRYAGLHFEEVNEILLKDLKVSEIQLDEFWSYIKKKEKNSEEEETQSEQAGDRYTYVALEAVSRFVIASACGRRVQETANFLLYLVASRVFFGLTILFTSDDWDQYLPALQKAFGLKRLPAKNSKKGQKPKVDYFLPSTILYAIIKKIKDISGKVIGRVEKIVAGSVALVQQVLEQSPVSTVLNTSFIERANGTFRAYCSRLVRKTLSFSKSNLDHDSSISVLISYYNFIAPHSTLTKSSNQKTSPAMAIGITDHCFSWKELCNFPVSCK